MGFLSLGLFISSLFFFSTGNAAALFDEKWRNSVHFSAGRGWNGPPTGVIIDSRARQFKLLHMLSSDRSGIVASKPQVWMQTVSKDGLQWTHDEEKFIFDKTGSSTTASYTYGSTIELKKKINNFRYLSLATKVENARFSLTYRLSNDLITSSKPGISTSQGAQSIFQFPPNMVLVDPGLFYLAQNGVSSLYAVAVDQNANSCQLVFLFLADQDNYGIVSARPLFTWQTNLVGTSVAASTLPRHCSSPQAFMIDNKAFIVLSARMGDGQWRTVYFSGTFQTGNMFSFSPNAPPKYFDAGYDAVDFKFTQGSSTEMMAMGWNGNYASIDRYPEGEVWRGGYTLPRQVKSVGNKLVQVFPPLLETNLGVGSTYTFSKWPLKVNGGSFLLGDNCINFDDKVGKQSAGRALSFKLNFDVQNGIGLKLTFKNKKNEASNKLVITYDRNSRGGWAVDRGSCHPDIGTKMNEIDTTMFDEWSSKKLHIVLDKAIIEVIPEGLPAITTSYFSGVPFDTFCVHSILKDGGALLAGSTARRLGAVQGTATKSSAKSAAALLSIVVVFCGFLL